MKVGSSRRIIATPALVLVLVVLVFVLLGDVSEGRFAEKKRLVVDVDVDVDGNGAGSRMLEEENDGIMSKIMGFLQMEQAKRKKQQETQKGGDGGRTGRGDWDGNGKEHEKNKDDDDDDDHNDQKEKSLFRSQDGKLDDSNLLKAIEKEERYKPTDQLFGSRVIRVSEGLSALDALVEVYENDDAFIRVSTPIFFQRTQTFLKGLVDDAQDQDNEDSDVSAPMDSNHLRLANEAIVNLSRLENHTIVLKHLLTTFASNVRANMLETKPLIDQTAALSAESSSDTNPPLDPNAAPAVAAMQKTMIVAGYNFSSFAIEIEVYFEGFQLTLAGLGKLINRTGQGLSETQAAELRGLYVALALQLYSGEHLQYRGDHLFCSMAHEIPALSALEKALEKPLNLVQNVLWQNEVPDLRSFVDATINSSANLVLGLERDLKTTGGSVEIDEDDTFTEFLEVFKKGGPRKRRG